MKQRAFRIVVAPTLFEWFLALAIWMGFGVWFYFGMGAGFIFLAIYAALAIPVSLAAFFPEYKIEDQTLYYRRYIAKLLKVPPKEIDLGKPFKIVSGSATSNVLSSDPTIAFASFIPFKIYFICDEQGAQLAPVPAQALKVLLPKLKVFSGYIQTNESHGSHL